MRAKETARDREGQDTRTERLTYPIATIVLNVYVPNNRASESMMQKPEEWKGADKSS